MNIYSAWKPGPAKLVADLVSLWRGAYRPVGGIFYASLFHFFGFDPLPYRIVVMAFLGINVWLSFRFARALGASELAAILTAVAVAYHAGMGNLHYNTDVVYDILCFTFYFGAFVFYAGVRGRGRLLRGWETVIFFALFLAALDSKEMAVTLPPALLLYELIYHPPSSWRFRELGKWLLGPGRVALYAAALNLLYIYGRMYGAEQIASMPAYAPVFSWERFRAFQESSLEQLFFLRHVTPAGAALFWSATGLIAWLSGIRALRFCWVFAWLAPLPIEFIELRGQSALYISLAGWAAFASIAILELARWIAALPGLRKSPRAVTATLLVLALVPWVRMNRRIQKQYVHPAMLDQGKMTWEVMQQFAALKPRVRPRSQVVVLEDPLPDYDMIYITNLSLGDRTVDVHLQRLENLPDSEIRKMRQFTWKDGRLRQLR